MKPKLFNEYHHTPLGYNRSGKSKGQVGMEDLINKHSDLEWKEKYPVTKYLIRNVCNEETFTEKKFLAGLKSLQKKRIISDEDVRRIYGLSRGIAPKRNNIDPKESKPKEEEEEEKKKTVFKVQPKVSRFELLRRAIEKSAAQRMEVYKNRNKPGGSSDKTGEVKNPSAVPMPGNRSAENISRTGRSADVKPNEDDINAELFEKFGKVISNPKNTRLAHDNFPAKRLNR